jgi:hypothetical protein
MKKQLFTTVLAFVGVLGTVAPPVSAAALRGASDAPGSDGRWSAWYGCWRPDAVEGMAPPEHVICVVPTSGEGVTIATIANGRIVSEQPIIADGSRHAVDAGGCKGFETATWSADGRRVFLKSDLNCGPDVQRTSTGILALVSTGSYVDVQAVDVGGEKASRTVRYVALPDNEVPAVIADRLGTETLARESGRVRAAAPLDFDDIVEATRVVGSDAIDGLLVARRAGFKLDASALRTLASAGVQPSTVDVMVALSYPKHFEVAEETGRDTRERNPWRDNGRDVWSSCYDDGWGRSISSYGYDPYAMRYSRCGYNSFYSPYGYDPYGWGYGSRPIVIVGNGGGGDPKDEDAKGALVKGKGYTRGGTATGSARPRSADTPARTGSTGTSSAGSTATVRSGGSTGSSASGSGSSTARTAKPKGGGL